MILISIGPFLRGAAPSWGAPFSGGFKPFWTRPGRFTDDVYHDVYRWVLLGAVGKYLGSIIGKYPGQSLMPLFQPRKPGAVKGVGKWVFTDGKWVFTMMFTDG